MKTEEAIEIINTSNLFWSRPNDKECIALNMAIEALKAKTDGHTISRQDAIETVGDWMVKEFGYLDLNRGERLIDAIEALPSADLWIPCDKKLPNEDEMYYNGVGIDGVRKVSDRVLAIDSKGFIRCGYFMSSMWGHPYHGAGRIVNCYTDPLKACWEFGEHYQQDPENWIVGGKGDIVAWMPLPEPWGGDTE